MLPQESDFFCGIMQVPLGYAQRSKNLSRRPLIGNVARCSGQDNGPCYVALARSMSNRVGSVAGSSCVITRIRRATEVCPLGCRDLKRREWGKNPGSWKSFNTAMLARMLVVALYELDNMCGFNYDSACN